MSSAWMAPSPYSPVPVQSRRHVARRHCRRSRPRPEPRPQGSASCPRCSPVPIHLPDQRVCPPVHPDPDVGRGRPAGVVRHWTPSGDRRRLWICGRGDCVVVSIGCSSFLDGSLSRIHYPRFRGAPSYPFSRPLLSSPSVDWGLDSSERKAWARKVEWHV